MLLITIELL